MPRFEPFPALRYAARDLAAVTAPPYDVLSVKEVAGLAERSPENVVHVDVPAVTHATAKNPYAAAGEVWRRWLTEGVLAVDDEPGFTIYRMRFTDEHGDERDLAAVVGALEVVDEGAGACWHTSAPRQRPPPTVST